MAKTCLNSFSSILLVLLGLILLSCGGGSSNDSSSNTGDNNKDITGKTDLQIRLLADTTSGKSPLTVNFNADPLNGVAPYKYAWYFDGYSSATDKDGKAVTSPDVSVDSNSQNPTQVFTKSVVVRVVVTDKDERWTEAKISINVDGSAVVNPPDAYQLIVGVDATPVAGIIPLKVGFVAAPSGGQSPYTYEWDFNNDSVVDSFVKEPYYTYTKRGFEKDDNGDGKIDRYYFKPTVTVTDARMSKVTASIEITVNPGQGNLVVDVNASPTLGQAPMSVQLSAAASGGASPYEYYWDFGDGEVKDYSSQSMISHTYYNPGTYYAKVRVKDTSGGSVTSGSIPIEATEAQHLTVTIQSDVKKGNFPFSASLNSFPSGGKSPYIYSWEVKNWDGIEANNAIDKDGYLTNNEIGISDLDTGSIVTPTASNLDNPQIHFANNSNDWRVVRLIVEDALGSTTVSKWIPIKIEDHVAVYTASRFSHQRANTAPHVSLGIAAQLSTSLPEARANAAICNHESGLVFIFGGEKISPTGEFEGIIPVHQAAWALNPTAADIGNDMFKYTTGRWTLLNTYNAPDWPKGESILSYDGTGAAGLLDPSGLQGKLYKKAFNKNSIYVEKAMPPDVVVRINNCGLPIPPDVTPVESSVNVPGRTSTVRYTNFESVGSASAVFAHEFVETNPLGKFPAPGTGIGHNGDYQEPDLNGDECSCDFMAFGGFVAYPDYPLMAFDLGSYGGNGFVNKGNPPNPNPPVMDNRALANVFPRGVPVIYVLGGRVSEKEAVNNVSKYYPAGFGTEKLPIDSNEPPFSADGYAFQVTNNQVDIWSKSMITMDFDQMAASGSATWDPTVAQRQAVGLPQLPVAVYGHQAFVLESAILGDRNQTMPYQPFSAIFMLGGKEGSGATSSDFRIFIPKADDNYQPPEDPRNPDFGWWSYVTSGPQGQGAVQYMPHARYFFKSVLMPANPADGTKWRLVVFGGYGPNNEFVDDVDMFTFSDIMNPTYGTWSTGVTKLARPAIGPAGGFAYATGNSEMLMIMGGRDKKRFTTDATLLNMSAGGAMSQSAVAVMPRYCSSSIQISHMSTQFVTDDDGGSVPDGGGGMNGMINAVKATNKSTVVIFGGVTEQGITNAVEVVNLPEVIMLKN